MKYQRTHQKTMKQNNSDESTIMNSKRNFKPIPKCKPTIILSVCNACIGNEILPGVTKQFNAEILNYNR